MKDVTIYSTPTCHFCDMAKTFFKENNVPFKEIDVKADLDERKKMIEMSGQMGVPVIVIGEDIGVGYDKNWLTKKLEL